MGIIDTIKQLFVKQSSGKDANKAIEGVKTAASRENYNQASLKAFYALETLGEVYTETVREEHQTAREYGKVLIDEGFVTEDEIEPILLNFEIAKYSEMQVSFDDYSKMEQSLDTVAKKMKSGRSGPSKSAAGGKKRRRRRRKPTRGGKTGAAKKRRRRRSSSGSDE